MVGAQQAPSAGTSGDDGRLDAELQRWIAASVITVEQAEAIRHLEQEAAGHPPPTSRIPLVAEALGLLGGALAAIAGIVATSRVWDRFSTTARLALLGSVAVLLTVAGRVVRRAAEPALVRLGSFLWVLACGAAGFWAAIFALDVLDWKGAGVALLIGVVASAVAAALWAWRPAPLQHLATLAGLAVTVAGLAGQVAHVGGLYVGIALWGLGAAWAVLAWARLVRPAPIGYAAGGLLAIGGGMVVGGQGAWGDALPILTALVLIGASVPTRSMVMLWVGVAGVFVSVPVTVFQHFGHSIGIPVALFIVGMALIGVAVGASRLVREVRAAPPRAARLSPRSTSGVLLGVVALVLVLTVGVTQLQMKSVPSFPSLQRTPDAAIQGSIAFVRPDGSRACVYVITASGAGGERRLLCERNIGQGPANVSWNQSGHIVVLENTTEGLPVAVEIVPADGRVVSRGPSATGPFDGKGFIQGTLGRSTDGAVLDVVDREGGRTSVVLHLASGATRQVFSTQGPRDYRFQYATWSPDGRYAVVVDSEHRLLVIDVEASTPIARLLVTHATAAAWGA